MSGVGVAGREVGKRGAWKLTFKKVSTSVWEEEGSCESNPRKLQVYGADEALDVFSSAVIVTSSDIFRGWNWVLHALTEAFHFKKSFEFKPIGP